MVNNPEYKKYFSTDGEHYIVTTTWYPQSRPIGVLQIVHGMREHIGRYEHFACWMNEKGFIVTGHDQLGHGRSASIWGRYGYFGENGGARTLRDDCSFYTDVLSMKYPDLPLFLLGHSMGSFVTRMSVLQTSMLLTGYICLGTAGARPGVALLRGYAELLCRTNGSEDTSIIIKRTLHGNFEKYLLKGESPEAWISKDKAQVEKYVKDPLTRFFFTNQGYADLLDLQLACNRPEWFRRMDPFLPVLFASGSDDPISNRGRDLPVIVKKLNEEVGMVDVSYKIYEGYRHEILNEVDNLRVYKDIYNWMHQRMVALDKEEQE